MLAPYFGLAASLPVALCFDVVNIPEIPRGGAVVGASTMEWPASTWTAGVTERSVSEIHCCTARRSVVSSFRSVPSPSAGCVDAL